MDHEESQIYDEVGGEKNLSESPCGKIIYYTVDFTYIYLEI